MSDRGPYLLDTNVFIEAKNSSYAFVICPGFWKSLGGHFEAGHLYSIDHVRQELLLGKDELADWTRNAVPGEFFLATYEPEITKRYQEIMLWVQRNTQFLDGAKADFAASADGWLIAYASVKRLVVVTHEQLRPGVKNKVPIPNVCDQFGVRYKDTFFMLKALNIKFEWNAEL